MNVWSDIRTYFCLYFLTDKYQEDKKSSRHNGKPKSSSKPPSSNHNNSGKVMPSSEKTNRTNAGGSVPLDGAMTPNTQQEALLDVISLNSASQDTTVSEADLVFDVNSEELKQFILEFQEESKKAQEDLNSRTRHQGVHSHKDDDDSLSSLSTCESHDGSLSSSLASGDYQVASDRVKLSKAAKGKSVRFLMSSLLNKNRTQPPDMLGSEDESKQDGKKTRARTNKKKEDKPRTAPAPKKETSTSKEKLRQILGEGDWEKKLKVNGIQHSISVEDEGEATSPRESSLPKQALQAAIKGDQQILVSLLKYKVQFLHQKLV